MAEQDKTVEIGIELDRQAESRFASSIDAATAKMKSLGEATRAAGNEFPPVARSTELFMQGLTKAAEAAKNYEDNIAQAGKATEDFNSKAGAASDSVGGGGFGLTGLRRTGGALSQLGFGELGGGLQRIGDIGQIGRELEQLGGNIGKLSPVTNALNSVLPESIAGFGTMATAIGAVAAAGAIFAIGLQKIQDAMSPLNQGLKEGVSRLDAYYEALKTGDANAIKSARDKAETDKKYTDLELQVLKDAKEKGFEYAQKTYGDLGARILTAAGATGAYGDGIKAVDDKIKELTDHSNNLTGQIAGLTDAYNSQEIQAQLLTQGLLENANAIKQKVAQDQQDQALAEQSVSAVQKKIKAQQDLLAQDQAEYNALATSGDTSQVVKDRMMALANEMGNLVTEIGKLSTTTLDAARNVEKLAKNEKDMQERADAQSKADDKRVQDMATAVAKADDDIAKITEQGLQKKIDIEKKYQDALLQAATRAAQQAADDLQKLYDQRAQNELSFQRGEADAQAKAQYDQLSTQIKYQEETAKSYQEHLDRLQDIQRNAQQQNVQNILDRNFLAIFQNQLSTSASMQNENIAFGRSERGRAQQEQAAQADNQRQMAFDHQQRLIAYERANADARTQYEIQIRDNHIAEQRAIDQARRAKTQELNDLSAATNQALSIRRQGLIAELQLITQGETQKLAIQQQFYQRAINYLNSASRGATVNMTYNVGNNAGRSEILQATARQTTQIVRQVFSAGGAQLVSS